MSAVESFLNQRQAMRVSGRVEGDFFIFAHPIVSNGSATTVIISDRSNRGLLSFLGKYHRYICVFVATFTDGADSKKKVSIQPERPEPKEEKPTFRSVSHRDIL